jgi:hypothetical protein
MNIEAIRDFLFSVQVPDFKQSKLLPQHFKLPRYDTLVKISLPRLMQGDGYTSGVIFYSA